MTFMTHDIHDHNLGKTGNVKMHFFKTCFFCAYFRDLFGTYMNYSYLCNVK